ncbi:tRNA (adenosine(37)-N6)-threonylcarbamoyltransferase complex ATPase subunit type 1 TsaE [Pseudodesulfovibrio sediminis]|uniref:tRNA threonylcarbamoyladenosine biosynthesis protein TsaE n=1 Tax=Pseudodesulfovibrio sediminis TaxID=2810563 RepID=A0ABM7P2J3_9BACT|nr:tRNA (adenosine(37)-N6)-threonylcarbamoyltransferase complex ATPase subunit type 1 TsaE [Pseudodesulfovibrio sediminis]BCS87047.1 tRNA (adenosine(37)-N6)-threonylcarbamoyltransferase complex ATPase subunit type 1 TsaE [Pseudodesulfovibrio sediminis]
MELEVYLKDPEATLQFGRTLGKAMVRAEVPPALLLQGDLGSGKTTLVRGLVESLPGADQAEVSSPSFNIFNLYPTQPPVAHFDLYRLEGMPPDDALFECLEDPKMVTVVEWIQFLEADLWPKHALFLKWTPSETGRSLTLRAMGRTAHELVISLMSEITTTRDEK